MKRLAHGGSRVQAVATLIVLGVLGCDRPAQTKTPLSSQKQMMRSNGVRYLTASDLQRDPARIDAAFTTSFQVNATQAEIYARRFATSQKYIGSQATLCLSLPIGSANHGPRAWQFVYAMEDKCSTWASLMDQAAEYWKTTKASEGNAPVAQSHISRAMLASRSGFFSIAVSAYSFRHPLYEAHRGLPLWVLRASIDRDVSKKCDPKSVHPLKDATRAESVAIGYQCGKDKRLYHHRSMKNVRPEQLATIRPAEQALVRLGRVTQKKYGARLDDRVDFLNRRWSDFLKGAAND
jgi:hypothetical protein